MGVVRLAVTECGSVGSHRDSINQIRLQVVWSVMFFVDMVFFCHWSDGSLTDSLEFFKRNDASVGARQKVIKKVRCLEIGASVSGQTKTCLNFGMF